MHDFHLGLLFTLGVAIVGGTFGAWFFQRLRIPQVVGYIVIGVLIGQSGFQLVGAEDMERLNTFNLFALGIIGFLVGGELQGSTFRKYGRQFTGILLGEGLAAFVLVGLATGAVIYAVSHQVHLAVSGGIVFGAIASATDPASTLDVLWEYRCRGLLTTAVIAVVALDDALAMTLYGLGTGVAQILAGGESAMGDQVLAVVVELGGAVAVGFLFGAALNYVVRRVPKPERAMGLAIGVILLSIGIAAAARMDVILATMTIGAVLTNLAPRRSRELFNVVRGFSAPIYVLFFVLVGARLALRSMPMWLVLLVGLYVILRSLGKLGGTALAARITRADPVLRRNLGYTLFAQGGVAVGLSIMASERLGNIPLADGLGLGDVVIFAVTASTLVVQLGGPPFVKWAARRADEIGRDVTEEDVMAARTVGDMMVPSVVALPEESPLTRIFQTFAEHDCSLCPVVDEEGHISGVLTMDILKEAVPSRDCWDWMVATDVMEPPENTLTPDQPLQTTLEDMDRLGVDVLPVLKDAGHPHPVGLLDRRRSLRKIGEEVLARRSAA